MTTGSSRAMANGAPEDPSQANGVDARLAAAEDHLRRQDEQIAVMLRALEEEREANRRLAGAATGLRIPPWVQSLSVGVQISGYVQADAVLHRQSSQDEVSPAGQPINQDRFSIPQAHLRVDLAQPVLSGVVEIEASTLNGPVLRPVDVELSARFQGPDAGGPPLVMVSVGLFKIPFGYEVPEISPNFLFLQRSTVARALFPGTYDLGIGLHGGYRFLRYALAFMNGEPTGEAGFPGQDPNAAKDFVARVGVDVEVVHGVRVFAGVSGLAGQGFHKGTPATKDTLVWRDDNQDGIVQLTEIQVIAGAAATPSENFARFAVGADARVTARIPVLGDLTVYGEVVRAENLDRGIEPADPVGVGRDLREQGFYFGVTQEATRYGMVGVRYDLYNPDADWSEQHGVKLVPSDRTYTTLAITGAARCGLGRLVFEYDHNTNRLGLTAGGLPTSLADDAVTLRAELRF